MWYAAARTLIVAPFAMPERVNAASGKRTLSPMFFENLRIALRAIFANKLRASLTVLGVMIGVASVIAVISLVQGMQYKISNDLQSVGSNYIEVFPDSGERRNQFLQKLPELTMEDAEAVRRVSPAIQEFTPLYFAQAETKHGD